MARARGDLGGVVCPNGSGRLIPREREQHRSLSTRGCRRLRPEAQDDLHRARARSGDGDRLRMVVRRPMRGGAGADGTGQAHVDGRSPTTQEARSRSSGCAAAIGHPRGRLAVGATRANSWTVPVRVVRRNSHWSTWPAIPARLRVDVGMHRPDVVHASSKPRATPAWLVTTATGMLAALSAAIASMAPSMNSTRWTDPTYPCRRSSCRPGPAGPPPCSCRVDRSASVEPDRRPRVLAASNASPQTQYPVGSVADRPRCPTAHVAPAGVLVRACRRPAERLGRTRVHTRYWGRRGGPRGGLRPAPRVGRIIGSFVQTCQPVPPPHRRVGAGGGRRRLGAGRATHRGDSRRVRLGGGARLGLRPPHSRSASPTDLVRPALAAPRTPPARICGSPGLAGSSAPPAGARVVRTSANLKRAVLSAPRGATLWLEPGEHHLGDGEYEPGGARRTARPSSARPAPCWTAEDEPLRVQRSGDRRHDREPHHPELRQPGQPTRGWSTTTPGTLDDHAQHDPAQRAVPGCSSVTETSRVQLPAGATASTASAPTSPDERPQRASSSATRSPATTPTTGNDARRAAAAPAAASSGRPPSADVTYNWVHDNHGAGLWADTNNTGFLISTATTSATTTAEGIVYETSYNAGDLGQHVRPQRVVAGPEDTGFPTPALYISESGSDPRAGATYGRPSDQSATASSTTGPA